MTRAIKLKGRQVSENKKGDLFKLVRLLERLVGLAELQLCINKWKRVQIDVSRLDIKARSPSIFEASQSGTGGALLSNFSHSSSNRR